MADASNTSGGNNKKPNPGPEKMPTQGQFKSRLMNPDPDYVKILGTGSSHAKA